MNVKFYLVPRYIEKPLDRAFRTPWMSQSLDPSSNCTLWPGWQEPKNSVRALVACVFIFCVVSKCWNRSVGSTKVGTQFWLEGKFLATRPWLRFYLPDLPVGSLICQKVSFQFASHTLSLN